MMLGDTIKKLRIEKGLKQKDLADKLFVTAQAVSRWENNEVEPSVSTIAEIAKIFDVSIGELIGEEKVVKSEQKVEQAQPKVVQEQPKVVLAVCRQCNKPIFESKDIVRKKEYEYDHFQEYIYCKTCDEKNKKKERDMQIYNSEVRRKRSFLWGGICTALIVFLALIITLALKLNAWIIVGTCVGSLLFFPFLSCLFLNNNIVCDITAEIMSWTIRWPGLIFTLDLDGIVWLLTVKLMFWILGAIASLACDVFAIALGLVVSIFVYPAALKRNRLRPDLTEVY